MEPDTDKQTANQSARLMVGLLGLIILGIAVLFVRERLRQPPGPPLPVISGISQFHTTNHLGQVVTLENLRGRVTVANIIFTRCPGPCLRMSRQFAELQKRLPEDGSSRLVSLTIDPDFDTAEVLRRYGEKLENDPERWWFLTGPLKEMRRLAIEDFKFVALEKDAAEQESPDDLFIHSTYFMVLDRRARVRAVVESSEPDALDQTMELVNRLRAER